MSDNTLQQQQENMERTSTDGENVVVNLNGENYIEQDEPQEIVESFGAMMHSGPLPHPEILAGYEDIVPGAADRILKMAEKEANHRHQIDNICVKADSRDSLLGIICAFCIGMACIVGGVYIILKTPTVAGSVAGFLVAGSGLAGILGTFLKGTKATWKIDKQGRE